MVTLCDNTALEEKENSGNIIDSTGPPSSKVIVNNDPPTTGSTSASCSVPGVTGSSITSAAPMKASTDETNSSTTSPKAKRSVSTVHGDDGGVSTDIDHNNNNDNKNDDSSNNKRPRRDDNNNVNTTAGENSVVVVAPHSHSGTSVPSATATDSEQQEPIDDDTAPSQSKPLDLAETLGLKAGDRLEVHWEIHNGDADEDDENNNNTTDNNDEDQDGGSPTAPANTIWWKATLLEHDGRTTDSVAIRVLDYDPQPEMGFPDRSQEDVIFLGHDLVVSPDDDTVQLTFRKEGETEQDQVYWYTEENLDEQLNSILMGALQKNEMAWRALPASVQASMAEKIQKKKEELKERLRSQNKVITPETIKEILAQAF